MFVYPQNISEIRVWNSFPWLPNGCKWYQSPMNSIKFSELSYMHIPGKQFTKNLDIQTTAKRLADMSYCFSLKREKGIFKSAFLKVHYSGLTQWLLPEMLKHHSRTKSVLFQENPWAHLAEGVKVTSWLMAGPLGCCHSNNPLTLGSLMEEAKRARLSSSLQKKAKDA